MAPDVPLVSSTTLFKSELCFSSLALAPFAAQLHRICRLPSHFPGIYKKGHPLIIDKKSKQVLPFIFCKDLCKSKRNLGIRMYIEQLDSSKGIHFNN